MDKMTNRIGLENDEKKKLVKSLRKKTRQINRELTG